MWNKITFLGKKFETFSTCGKYYLWEGAICCILEEGTSSSGVLLLNDCVLSNNFAENDGGAVCIKNNGNTKDFEVVFNPENCLEIYNNFSNPKKDSS